MMPYVAQSPTPQTINPLGDMNHSPPTYVSLNFNENKTILSPKDSETATAASEFNIIELGSEDQRDISGGTEDIGVHL